MRHAWFIGIGFWLVMVSGFEAASADNWPHWRGENGNGVSTTATPPTDWSASRNVRWKVPVAGRGSSSPIVWGDQIFLTSAVPVEGSTGNRPQLRFVIWSFDRATGDVIWQRVAREAQPHEGTHSTNGFASASPCTDGERLYVSFGSQGIYCYTLEGQLLWTRQLGRMQTRNEFGEGSSPTLAGDKLIVPWDHQGQSYLFALDRRTGEIVWQVERDEPTCWATPLIVPSESGPQIIMNGQNFARAYDLETGAELWRCGGQTMRPVASPVFANGIVYIGSGFRGAFLGAFTLDGRGDIAGTDAVLWTKNRDTPDIASLLLTNNRVYYYKAKTGLLSCVDAKTGEPFYTTERIGLTSIYASPVAAGGHIYLSDREGTTVVIKDSPQLEIVATNTLGETLDATPAPVGNALIVRGERHLFQIATP